MATSADATTAGAHGHGNDHHFGEEHPPAVIPSARMPLPQMGVLFFIGSEIALFGAFFMSYFFTRVVQNPNFSSWQEQIGAHIPVGVATVATLILFASSVTIHYATIALRRNARKWVAIWVAATLVLGAVFLGFQVAEYAELIGHHAGPSVSAYNTVFFSITGLHGSHVLVGLILLAIMLLRTLRGHYGPKAEEHVGFESMAIYWHFVDAVWVFVFGLVYLPGLLDELPVALLLGGIVALAVLFVLPNYVLPKHAGHGH